MGLTIRDALAIRNDDAFGTLRGGYGSALTAFDSTITSAENRTQEDGEFTG